MKLNVRLNTSLLRMIMTAMEVLLAIFSERRGKLMIHMELLKPRLLISQLFQTFQYPALLAAQDVSRIQPRTAAKYLVSPVSRFHPSSAVR